MILKALKEKSNRRCLNKLLSKRQKFFNNDSIRSLGVVINMDEFGSFDVFQNLAATLKIRPEKLNIIGFSEKGNHSLNFWDLCFHSHDIGWNGSIKNLDLEAFLKTKFDVLISYYEHEILELKLITALSSASFKIGVFQTDNRLNDLILKTPVSDFELFRRELMTYLKVLKKIN